MRIVLIGQAAFAEKVLERLIERGENVVGVYCPPDSPARPDPLRVLAQKSEIPVFQPERWKERSVIREYKSLSPDLNVMAFVTDIIPSEVLEYPTHGSIQYHPSLLPRHRGKSAINWAVINGDKRTGLSIFWVDAGIDTGPVLLQKEVDVDPDDTTGTLYFNKLFPLGVDALVEALDMIKAGRAPKIVQDESQATYEPPCEEQYARIDWRMPLQDVHNLIRGCDPQPGAYTLFRGNKLQIYATRALFGDEATGEARPGQVIEIKEEGVVVAGNGGAFLIQRVRPQGEGKIAAVEFARNVNLAQGDEL
jgi:methionyl-tRNA formyltransferase